MKRFLLFLLVLVNLSQVLPVLAMQPTDTVAGTRMESLINKLQGMTDAQITKAVTSYPDVASNWCKRNIGRLSNLEILKGYTDGSFRPGETLNADQFIKMLVLSLGYQIESGYPYWAQPYIDLAIAPENNIVRDGEIVNPKAPLTRQMAAVFALRAYLLVHENVEPDREYLATKIKDNSYIDIEYRDDVMRAYQVGLISGKPFGQFDPEGQLTRAEGVAIVARLLDATERVPVVVQPDEVVQFTNPYSRQLYLAQTMEFFPYDHTRVMSFDPGSFILPEIYPVFKTMVEGYNSRTENQFLFPYYSEISTNFSVDFYADQATMDYQRQTDGRLMHDIAAFGINNNLISKGEGDRVSCYGFVLKTQADTFMEQYGEYARSIIRAIYPYNQEEGIKFFDQVMSDSAAGTLTSKTVVIGHRKAVVTVGQGLSVLVIEFFADGVK